MAGVDDINIPAKGLDKDVQLAFRSLRTFLSLKMLKGCGEGKTVENGGKTRKGRGSGRRRFKLKLTRYEFEGKKENR